MSATLTQTIADGVALDVHRTTSDVPTAAQLARIRATSGLSHTAIITSFAKLARGPGKLSFADYVRLRMFDAAFNASAAAVYVGQRRNRDICVTANYRHDWYGLLSDKVAVSGYLSNYGFPTIPIAEVYAPELSRKSERVLTDR